jgi:molecular chaperone GrpE
MKEKETFSPENEEMNINADADIPGNTHLSNPDGEDAMEKMQAELEEQKDKYLRLFAEFDNFKRRSAKERIELIQTAGKDVIISMLGVMDDCDRAEKQLNNESTDIATQKEGIQLVFNKLRSTLQARGLTAMESINTEFDVEKHEAITEVEVPEEQKGKVVDEVEKGYYLNNKIIRFAKVVVGK